MALGGVVVMLAMMAGPASAQTSGGAVATDGSVASGTAHASKNSTASGESTAVNGSTASGCSTAINNSTASGEDNCGGGGGGTTVTTRPSGGGGGGATTTSGGGAASTTARLALTGSWSLQLTALAALAIAMGALLMVSAQRRATSRA